VAASSWSVVEGVGRWSVELRRPATLGALDRRIRDLLAGSLAALAPIARPAAARVSAIAHDGDRVTAVAEHVPVSLDGPMLDGAPGTLTDAFVDLDVVLVAPPDGASARVPRAGTLAVIGDVEVLDGRARVRGLSAFLELAVDAWLDETIALPEGTHRDNRDWAALNRPRLEDALRAWEGALGTPIAQATSRLYPDRVRRYGFS
jgi:hypothetical protein